MEVLQEYRAKDSDFASKRRFPVLIFVLILMITFISSGIYFMLFRNTPNSVPEERVSTVLINFTTTPTGTDWQTYLSDDRSFSLNYPPFWTQGAPAVIGKDDLCTGPAFYTLTGNSRMTVCQFSDPLGIEGVKSDWIGKAEVVQGFTGGHNSIRYEYKQSANQYEYFALVENKDATDLLWFHLVTDIGEKDAVNTIFNKVLGSLRFVL